MKKQYRDKYMSIETLHTFGFSNTSSGRLIEIHFDREIPGGWYLALETSSEVINTPLIFWYEQNVNQRVDI